MITLKRRTGNAGEDAAVAHLKKLKYKILERNYNVPGTGEVDIIARLGGALIFVEVKTRASAGYGGAAAAVTRAKQNKITKAALAYLRRKNPKFDAIMFDIITVTDERIEHLKNAFAVEGYMA